MCLIIMVGEMFCVCVCVVAKATPQVGRPSKQPQKRELKHFKNVDSKLANMILNEIVDT